MRDESKFKAYENVLITLLFIFVVWLPYRLHVLDLPSGLAVIRQMHAVGDTSGLFQVLHIFRRSHHSLCACR